MNYQKAETKIEMKEEELRRYEADRKKCDEKIRRCKEELKELYTARDTMQGVELIRAIKDGGMTVEGVMELLRDTKELSVNKLHNDFRENHVDDSVFL